MIIVVQLPGSHPGSSFGKYSIECRQKKIKTEFGQFLRVNGSGSVNFIFINVEGTGEPFV